MRPVQRRLLHLYVAAVCLLAVAAVAAVALVDPGIERAWLGVLGAVAIALSHLFETNVRRSVRERESYTHDETFLVVLALLASPLVAVAAFAVGFAAGNVLVRRQPIKGVFNVAALTLQTAVAAVAIDLLRGDDVAGARTAAAAIVGVIAFFALNRLLMATVLTVAGVGPLRANLLDDLRGRAIVTAGDGAVGVLAGLAAVTDVWTLPFAVVAVAVLHYALSGHAAARSERQKLADVVASTSDGIVSVGRDGRVQAWNPACERLTGFAANDVVGKRLDDVGTMLQAERRHDGSRSLPGIDEAAPDELYDVRIRRADGGERWLAVTRAPTPDQGAVIVLRDETRRREADELRAQEEGERLRADLVAAVSHELRTPLTSMLGFTETLLRQQFEPAETNRYLTIVREQGHRLRSLIDGLLDLRGATEQPPGEPREILDLRELLEEQAHELAATAPAHEIRVELSDRPALVEGHRTRLRQVVANLLSNAIKYSPGGGRVFVRVALDGGRVRVSVRDEGLGIPADEQAHIFERFFRARRAARSDIGGTGLGLALSREIVRAHGGTIGFESAEGHGSTFYFEVPLAEDADWPPG